MRIAVLSKPITGKIMILNLGFLQTDHIRLLIPDQFGQQRQPQAQRVDIPRQHAHLPKPLPIKN
jgi:hypothetical protein